MDVSKILVGPKASALDALRVIDLGAEQIALIVDDQRRLLGTLTDGDVRRGLLHGATIDTPVHQLMNTRFTSVKWNEDHSAVVERMKSGVLRQVPVLDECGRVVELLLLDELCKPAELPNAVVIMAGGKGKRLWPRTENCPKPMLHVDGKPMLQILLEQYIAIGFKHFYLSVNYLKEQIIDYFQDGNQWGISIDYLVEDAPLGTAGSLQLLPASVSEPFLVINGDVLTRLNPLQLLRFHNEHQAKATLCVREHLVTVPFGVVQTNGVELAGFQEKPSYGHLVNAGVYVIDPQLLPLLSPHQPTDMPSLLQDAQSAGHCVAVYPIHEYWLDVGRPESLEEAHATWESSGEH